MRAFLLAIVAAAIAFACHPNPNNTPFNTVATGGRCERAIDCTSNLCELNVCVDACSDGSPGKTTSDQQFDARTGCGRN